MITTDIEKSAKTATRNSNISTAYKMAVIVGTVESHTLHARQESTLHNTSSATIKVFLSKDQSEKQTTNKKEKIKPHYKLE